MAKEVLRSRALKGPAGLTWSHHFVFPRNYLGLLWSYMVLTLPKDLTWSLKINMESVLPGLSRMAECPNGKTPRG